MRRFLLPLTLLTLGFAASCGDDSTLAPPKSDYLEPTSPENLVANLVTAYHNRNIGEYAKLLAPEFRFEFQSTDAQEIGLDSWNKDQDSTGTDALFRTPLVSTIRIALPHTGAQDPTEVGFDPGTRKIRINPTFLEVDETGGTTWQVDGDIQDMFFRKGREAAGEDTTRWLLFEWRDIPDGSPTAVLLQNPTTAPVTWGRIKSLYRNAEAFPAPAATSKPLAIRGETWGGIKSMYEIN